jgi:TonB family protein
VQRLDHQESALPKQTMLRVFAITRSSGDEDLDAAARTLVRSAHFSPPRGGEVHVATSFNYVP